MEKKIYKQTISLLTCILQLLLRVVVTFLSDENDIRFFVLFFSKICIALTAAAVNIYTVIYTT